MKKPSEILKEWGYEVKKLESHFHFAWKEDFSGLFIFVSFIEGEDYWYLDFYRMGMDQDHSSEFWNSVEDGEGHFEYFKISKWDFNFLRFSEKIFKLCEFYGPDQILKNKIGNLIENKTVND